MNSNMLRSAMLGRPVQHERLVKLDTPLGPDILLPHRVKGWSRLGRQFEFIVDAVSVSDNIELKKLIAQPVTLWIQQSDQSYAPHHGYVHSARRLGSDSGVTYYQIAFASFLHFLKFRRDQRIWQDQSAEDIIADVLNQHPQAKGRFAFRLYQPVPIRSFCMQDEDDWNFVHRLMESEGLYGFWEQDRDGKSHRFVIVDRLDALPALSPRVVHFHRAGTSDEADTLVHFSGTRTLRSVERATRTFDYKQPPTAANPKATHTPTIANQGDLPQQLEVYEYTGAHTYAEQSRGDHLSKLWMEDQESRAKRFHGVGGVRRMDAGRTFQFADHPEHDKDDPGQREFAVIETAWVIVNNLPVADEQAVFPHSLKAEIDSIVHATDSALSRVRHSDGSEGFFQIRVEAQRTTVPFRSPFEHAKPTMHLQSAIVVAPQGEEVHTDALNRVKVRFHWDRLNDGDEKASCWLRATTSDSGNGYGAVHPHRSGEEVLVDFVGGDCDRPIIVGKVYNGATSPQWHSNGILSGYRSKEYAGVGYNQLVLDDATSQNRVHLYSSQTNAHLHLGYLIEHAGNNRGSYLGSGFDLRSDAYGAVRANRGLYVTTHEKQPASQPLDVQETQQQLVRAEGLMEAMSDVSTQHRAEPLESGHSALKQFTDATQRSVTGSTSGGRTAGGGTGIANAFKEPVMLFGSPAGIGMSTQQSVHVAADRHINVVSGQSTHVAAGKSLVASVIDRISLFAQNAGIKLFAGKGRVEVQAQADNIELTAQKTLKLIAATGALEGAAANEILLTSGGAYIRIADGNIEVHAPGKIDVKGAQHAFSGPTHLAQTMPTLPNSTGNYDQAFIAHWAGTDIPVANTRYQMFSNGKLISEGVTNAAGETGLTQSHVPHDVVVKFLGKSNG
ncbi:MULTISPECIES: type VI secretion system Vgr family protein [Burkholderia]|uniref:type VI secretion system Vgr family protein n=1 Tax=Burkholderia TaxID=32008 RepID=UPI0005522D70|nr:MULTISPECIES: type VI secretion system Vgr family protein [Burkholderia]TCT29983.1 type VI secretion system secreted protein VgrG [Burkholderia vietnamiensis]SCZ26282.1 type VI secretion system secreted protein VgrG [Burkholderia vietnamiensis]SFX48769.1 type VI secretion system secreted protein VgrG [Burkholderia vietnamiensis]